jgi:hypothetical protein
MIAIGSGCPGTRMTHSTGNASLRGDHSTSTVARIFERVFD